MRVNFKKEDTLPVILLWLLIVPPGLFYIWHNFMPQDINVFRVCMYSLLAMFASALPVKVNGRLISLTMWVGMAAFLEYGLLIQMFIIQMTLLSSLLAHRNGTGIIRRLFVNSIIVFIISIAAATAFYAVNGEVGTNNFWLALISMAVYRLVYTISNLAFVKLYWKIMRVESSFTARDDVMEYASVLLLLPLALILYFLLPEIGESAFALIGIPYLVTVFILRQSGRSEKINEDLKAAGILGHELAGIADEQEVNKQFIKNVSRLFDSDHSYLYKNHDGWLERICAYEFGVFVDSTFPILALGEGISGTVLKENRAVLFHKKAEWPEMYLPFAGNDFESVLSVPVYSDTEISYVMLLGARRKKAFREYQLKILDILSSYFVVSLEKAGYMREALAKSEKCALTKLYNYKYLEDRLHLEMKKIMEGDGKILSVVMMDIDHFKKVNDMYGHQSGNDVLVKLAELLGEAVPPGGTIGRYGGEEFLFLLPGLSKTEVLTFAENLRLAIKNMVFEIIPDLSAEKEPINISITASIGISSAPADTDEAITLIRNADRALYIGAKQAGRDRVAEYIR